MYYDQTSDYMYAASTFLDDINRGGLSRPTEYAIMCALHCWRVFNIVRSSPELITKFLSSTAHRSPFCKIMDRAMDGDTVLVSDNYCYKEHDLKTLVVRRFFNCVAKNLVREMTNSANQHSELPSKKRKITKLQSVADLMFCRVCRPKYESCIHLCASTSTLFVVADTISANN